MPINVANSTRCIIFTITLKNIARNCEKMEISEGSLVIIIGSTGPARTLAAERVASKLNCEIVSDDVLFGQCTQLFGSERKFCMFSEIALNIQRRGRVVVSAAAKSLSSFGNKHKPELVDKLQRAMPYISVKTCVLTQSENWSILNKYGDSDDVGTVHSEKSCSSIVASADVQGTFPVEDTQIPLTFFDDLTLCRNINIWRKTTCLYNQMRVIYSTPASKTFKHETISFTTILLNIPESCIDLPTEIEARYVVIDGQNGCSLYILPDRIHDGVLLTGQHITIDPGKKMNGTSRKPAYMRQVANAINNHEKEIELDDEVLELTIKCDRTESVHPIGMAIDAF